MLAGGKTRPPHTPSHKAWALLASLAMHVLLALWLGRSASRRLATSRPVEVIAMDVQTAQADAPTPPGAVSSISERPFPAKTRPGWAAHRRPSVLAPRPDRPVAGQDRGGVPSAAAIAAPTDSVATLQMRSGPPVLDARTLGRFEREGVIGPSVAPEGTRPVRGPTFSERLAARQRDDNAHVAVFEGRVHPLLYDFGRDAQRDFKPAEGHLYADSRAPNTVGRALRSWAHDFLTADPQYLWWQRSLAAQKAGARGSTLDEAEVLRNYDKMIVQNAAGAEPIACLICVVLKPGALPKVELRTSSGNGEMDRAALEALTHATLRRPLDPDVKPERACYQFTATVRRVPPLPIAGCGFDEVKLTFGCYYPTMRVLHTAVTLESVDYGG
jgi:hypothetical protein